MRHQRAEQYLEPIHELADDLKQMYPLAFEAGYSHAEGNGSGHGNNRSPDLAGDVVVTAALEAERQLVATTGKAIRDALTQLERASRALGQAGVILERVVCDRPVSEDVGPLVTRDELAETQLIMRRHEVKERARSRAAHRAGSAQQA